MPYFAGRDLFSGRSNYSELKSNKQKEKKKLFCVENVQQLNGGRVQKLLLLTL